MSLSEHCNLAFLRGNVSFEMCLLKCVFWMCLLGFLLKDIFQKENVPFWNVPFELFLERHISKGTFPFWHFFCLLKFVFQKKIRQTEMSLLKRHITSFQKGHFPEKRLNAGKTHFSLQKGNVPFKRDICLFRRQNSTCWCPFAFVTCPTSFDLVHC